jgi:septum formation protein
MRKIILASGSPRRKELLEKLEIKFDIQPSNLDENFTTDMLPQEVVENLSQQKAADISEKNPDAIVIGVDTVISIDYETYGKPKDREDAIRIMKKLSGKTHSVFTGVSIKIFNEGFSETFIDETKVTFKKLSDYEIARYTDRKDIYDFGGGYAIQEIGSIFIEKIEGDYTTVIGLPMRIIYNELTKLGIEIL